MTPKITGPNTGWHPQLSRKSRLVLSHRPSARAPRPIGPADWKSAKVRTTLEMPARGLRQSATLRYASARELQPASVANAVRHCALVLLLVMLSGCRQQPNLSVRVTAAGGVDALKSECLGFIAAYEASGGQMRNWHPSPDQLSANNFCPWTANSPGGQPGWCASRPFRLRHQSPSLRAVRRTEGMPAGLLAPAPAWKQNIEAGRWSFRVCRLSGKVKRTSLVEK
jgi:hypothetical protein